MKLVREITIPPIKINYIAAILVWKIILLSFVNSDHEILETTIKDGDTKIHLRWLKTKQLLSNVHVPVWLVDALHDKTPHLVPQKYIEENIGDFVMYHDLRIPSAVVYFKKLDALYGIVDTRYFIDSLPMSQLHLIHSNGPYIKKVLPSVHTTVYTNENNVSTLQNTKYFQYEVQPDDSSRYLPSAKRFQSNLQDGQKITYLYPEVLIFVPYHILELAKMTGSSYISTVIKDHIIIFNAIDMMMAKLSTHDIKIYLNIAGFIIDRKNVFPLPTRNLHGDSNCLHCFKEIHAVEAEIAMSHFELFLRTHREIFVPDSYDFYYTSTTKLLSRTNVVINGLSKTVDIYNQRISKMYYPQLQGLFIHRGYIYDYAIAAHEIGHLLGLHHDPPDEGLSPSTGLCRNVMQPHGIYCIKCLEWSKTSFIELRDFIRRNFNHCFLLNKPRSLHPRGRSIKTLSPADQCRCYGLKPHIPDRHKTYSNMIHPSRCNKELTCDKNNVRTPIPFDGTPCGVNKVCWNSKCMKLEIEL